MWTFFKTVIFRPIKTMTVSLRCETINVKVALVSVTVADDIHPAGCYCKINHDSDQGIDAKSWRTEDFNFGYNR